MEGMEGMGEERGEAKGYGVSFWHDENVLKLILVMVVQLCEYTKNYWIVHFKWVICTVYELHCNKAVTKKILIISFTEKKREDRRVLCKLINSFICSLLFAPFIQ